MNFVGIDPGVAPTMCAFYGGLDTIEIVEGTAISTKTQHDRNKAYKWTIEGKLVLETLDSIQPDWVFMEKIGPQPTWNANSMSRFIGAYQYTRGLVEGAGYKYVELLPKEWQALVHMLKGGHHETRHMVMELLPQHAPLFRLLKDHNRAAAALIAVAGYWLVTDDKRRGRINGRQRLNQYLGVANG